MPDNSALGNEANPDIAAALTSLLNFLDAEPITEWTARLEYEIDGSTGQEALEVVAGLNIDRSVFTAAALIRQRLGRIDDTIHALGILFALSSILEPGEKLDRPSLGSGNDPSRPFDLETNIRVAEFKFARWKGSDAQRKRLLFKDLVHLAAESSGRRRQLYVLGTRPIHFLKTSTSTANWGLDRFPPSRELFESQFGSLDMSIADFVAGPAERVEIVDLESLAPEVFKPN